MILKPWQYWASTLLGAQTTMKQAGPISSVVKGKVEAHPSVRPPEVASERWNMQSRDRAGRKCFKLMKPNVLSERACKELLLSSSMLSDIYADSISIDQSLPMMFH